MVGRRLLSCNPQCPLTIYNPNFFHLTVKLLERDVYLFLKYFITFSTYYLFFLKTTSFPCFVTKKKRIISSSYLTCSLSSIWQTWIFLFHYVLSPLLHNFPILHFFNNFCIFWNVILFWKEGPGISQPFPQSPAIFILVEQNSSTNIVSCTIFVSASLKYFCLS